MKHTSVSDLTILPVLRLESLDKRKSKKNILCCIADEISAFPRQSPLCNEGTREENDLVLAVFTNHIREEQRDELSGSLLLH